MNKIELLGHYGSDLIHAQSAWTSTSRDITEEKKARVGKLLKMLASEGHHTPFEKSSFHFLVNVEQATHIHLLKHRIGVSINGESARYKELKEDKTYIHKGIASRAFTRKFTLADTVEVVGADIESGMLNISLKNIIPESKKERKIVIGPTPKPLEQLLNE